MKINSIKPQLFFVIILLFIVASNLSAQDSTNIGRLNFKLGYSQYQNTTFYFDNWYKEDWPNNKTPVGNVRLSTNYSINKFIDAGAYFGYSLYETSIPHVYSMSIENASSIMYGLNSNIHILPFFIEKERLRIDAYCAMQFGGIHLFEPEGGINTKKNYAEYGIYGGLAFYPFRHLGLYFEYGYAKYANLRYGLGLKF